MYLVSKHSFRDGGDSFPDHFNLYCRYTSSPNPLRSHAGDCRNRALVRVPSTDPTQAYVHTHVHTHVHTNTLIAIKIDQ